MRRAYRSAAFRSRFMVGIHALLLVFTRLVNRRLGHLLRVVFRRNVVTSGGTKVNNSSFLSLWRVRCDRASNERNKCSINRSSSEKIQRSSNQHSRLAFRKKRYLRCFSPTLHWIFGSVFLMPLPECVHWLNDAADASPVIFRDGCGGPFGKTSARIGIRSLVSGALGSRKLVAIVCQSRTCTGVVRPMPNRSRHPPRGRPIGAPVGVVHQDQSIF